MSNPYLDKINLLMEISYTIDITHLAEVLELSIEELIEKIMEWREEGIIFMFVGNLIMRDNFEDRVVRAEKYFNSSMKGILNSNADHSRNKLATIRTNTTVAHFGKSICGDMIVVLNHSELFLKDTSKDPEIAKKNMIIDLISNRIEELFQQLNHKIPKSKARSAYKSVKRNTLENNRLINYTFTKEDLQRIDENNHHLLKSD